MECNANTALKNKDGFTALEVAKIAGTCRDRDSLSAGHQDMCTILISGAGCMAPSAPGSNSSLNGSGSPIHSGGAIASSLPSVARYFGTVVWKSSSSILAWISRGTAPLQLLLSHTDDELPVSHSILLRTWFVQSFMFFVFRSRVRVVIVFVVCMLREIWSWELTVCAVVFMRSFMCVANNRRVTSTRVYCGHAFGGYQCLKRARFVCMLGCSCCKTVQIDGIISYFVKERVSCRFVLPYCCVTPWV